MRKLVYILIDESWYTKDEPELMIIEPMLEQPVEPVKRYHEELRWPFSSLFGQTNDINHDFLLIGECLNDYNQTYLYQLDYAVAHPVAGDYISRHYDSITIGSPNTWSDYEPAPGDPPDPLMHVYHQWQLINY